MTLERVTASEKLDAVHVPAQDDARGRASAWPAPAVYLNGTYSPSRRVSDIAPRFIELMVSCRSSAWVPPQPKDIRANSECGTAAIFTI